MEPMLTRRMESRAALVRGFLRDMILDHEEKHPATDGLDAAAWIARVAEVIGVAATAVDRTERGALDQTILQAKLGNVGAEAVRAAARFSPGAESRKHPLPRAIDDALDRVEEAIDRRRELRRAGTDLALALGLAASAAVNLDAERRGELVYPDRAPAIGSPPLNAVTEGFLAVAEVAAELIESLLPADGEDPK